MQWCLTKDELTQIIDPNNFQGKILIVKNYVFLNNATDKIYTLIFSSSYYYKKLKIYYIITKCKLFNYFNFIKSTLFLNLGCLGHVEENNFEFSFKQASKQVLEGSHLVRMSQTIEG